jgi:hypothetical protein
MLNRFPEITFQVQEGQHLTLIGEVGFHKLPEQVTAKSKGRGFDLNVLILGMWKA